jgi:hypothetical protein
VANKVNDSIAAFDDPLYMYVTSLAFVVCLLFRCERERRGEERRWREGGEKVEKRAFRVRLCRMRQ